MAWKQDEEGHLVVDANGNPVWNTETGEDKPVDYTGLTKRLSEVNAESKARKEKLRALEEKFAPLAEIEDLAAYMEEAGKAIEMMKAAPDRDKDIEAQVQSRLEAVSGPLKSQLAAKDKGLQSIEVTDKNIGSWPNIILPLSKPTCSPAGCCPSESSRKTSPSSCANWCVLGLWMTPETSFTALTMAKPSMGKTVVRPRWTLPFLPS